MASTKGARPFRSEARNGCVRPACLFIINTRTTQQRPDITFFSIVLNTINDKQSFMPDKEKDWNYHFTAILFFIATYTVIKDAYETNLIKTILELIGAIFVTYLTIKRIEKQIK
jgi:hypothetical protein